MLGHIAVSVVLPGEGVLLCHVAVGVILPALYRSTRIGIRDLVIQEVYPNRPGIYSQGPVEVLSCYCRLDDPVGCTETMLPTRFCPLRAAVSARSEIAANAGSLQDEDSGKGGHARPLYSVL